MAIFWGVFRPNVAGAPKKKSHRARVAHARDDFWRSILDCRIFGIRDRKVRFSDLGFWDLGFLDWGCRFRYPYARVSLTYAYDDHVF